MIALFSFKGTICGAVSSMIIISSIGIAKVINKPSGKEYLRYSSNETCSSTILKNSSVLALNETSLIDVQENSRYWNEYDYNHHCY